MSEEALQFPPHRGFVAPRRVLFSMPGRLLQRCFILRPCKRPTWQHGLHVVLRIFPEEQLRVEEVLIFQAIVDRLAGDVVVHLVLHDDQGR